MKDTTWVTVAEFERLSVGGLTKALAALAHEGGIRGSLRPTAIGLLETRQEGRSCRRAVGFFRSGSRILEVSSDGETGPVELGEGGRGTLLGTALGTRLAELREVRGSLARAGVQLPAGNRRGAWAAHWVVGSFPTSWDAAGKTMPVWVCFHGDARSTVVSVHAARTARLIHLFTLPASMTAGIQPALGWGFVLKLLLLAAALLGIVLLLKAAPGLLVLGIAAKWAVLIFVIAVILHVLDILLEILQANAAANAARIAKVRGLMARLNGLKQSAEGRKKAGQPGPTKQDVREAQAALDETRELFEEMRGEVEEADQEKFDDAFEKAREALDKLR